MLNIVICIDATRYSIDVFIVLINLVWKACPAFEIPVKMPGLG